MKRFEILAVFLALGLISNTSVAAPSCSSDYVVEAGDSLSGIAITAYGDVNLWPYIYGYSANTAIIGDNPGFISIGTTLRLPPCPSAESAVQTEEMPNDDLSLRTNQTIEVMTAGDYQPFTDQKWDNGGMLAEVVNAALSNAPGTPGFSIDWINDWSAHIDPLLRRHKYDMGFPWFQPDCGQPDNLSEEDRKRCEFLFSDSLFDMLIILFKRADDQTELNQDSDLHGKRLCRPAGYFTFDLTQRGLIPGETIELETPQGVDDCFHKLVDGEIDYVTMNQFTGQSTMNEFGYGDLVRASEDLADSLGLHLIIHRDHPQAERLLKQFDDGLVALKQSGRYDEIVGRHLAIYHGLSS